MFHCLCRTLIIDIRGNECGISWSRLENMEEYVRNMKKCIWRNKGLCSSIHRSWDFEKFRASQRGWGGGSQFMGLGSAREKIHGTCQFRALAWALGLRKSVSPLPSSTACWRSIERSEVWGVPLLSPPYRLWNFIHLNGIIFSRWCWQRSENHLPPTPIERIPSSPFPPYIGTGTWQNSELSTSRRALGLVRILSFLLLRIQPFGEVSSEARCEMSLF